MSRWFRLYDEMLDDPKVQMLSPELFKTWINLLALASRNSGALPTVTQVAFALRLSIGDAQSRIDDLILVGLIDICSDKSIEPHNWHKRQWKSDDSKDRVRKHRERKKQADVDTETTCVTVTVTAPETEADTDTEVVKSQPATKVETVAASAPAENSSDLSDEMVASVLAWGNGMNQFEARTWISTTVKTFGQRQTARAYHQLKTELATGQVIGHPLRAWGAIAERMLTEAKSKADDAKPKMSRQRAAIQARMAKAAEAERSSAHG